MGHSALVDLAGRPTPSSLLPQTPTPAPALVWEVRAQELALFSGGPHPSFPAHPPPLPGSFQEPPAPYEEQLSTHSTPLHCRHHGAALHPAWIPDPPLPAPSRWNGSCFMPLNFRAVYAAATGTRNIRGHQLEEHVAAHDSSSMYLLLLLTGFVCRTSQLSGYLLLQNLLEGPGAIQCGQPYRMVFWASHLIGCSALTSTCPFQSE